MKLDMTSPDADLIMVAFDGQIVGWVREADDVEGYIIQFQPREEEPLRLVRKNGKVAFLGNVEVEDRDVIMERFNKHRADCGLPPYENA